MPTSNVGKELSFFKGNLDTASGLNDEEDWTQAIDHVRKSLGDIMNSQHLAFLLGSGCSSRWDESESKEVGIPTMGPMAKSFFELIDDGISEEERNGLVDVLGIDLADSRFANNLETLMEVLFSFRHALQQSTRDEFSRVKPLVESVIAKTLKFVLECCTQGPFSEDDQSVQSTYEGFYRKLIQRDRSLPRAWIFTTNYDMFNETAMDRLGIPYMNGFQGSIERRFNPASFRYTLAEQLDQSNRKWSSVDSLVYFAKLHGSISWKSVDDGIFPIVETSPKLVNHDSLLIYPTPAKQNASFASPYSDLFREFQTRVVRSQSSLVTIGYGFGDVNRSGFSRDFFAWFSHATLA
jgi:hypothetical protein